MRISRGNFSSNKEKAGQLMGAAQAAGTVSDTVTGCVEVSQQRAALPRQAGRDARRAASLGEVGAIAAVSAG